MGYAKVLTPRLELVPATAEVVRSELWSHSELALVLGARVPANWPPPLAERSGLHWTAQQLEADASRAGWLLWYWLRRVGPERVLIGVGGFKGKPTVEGAIETGYSVSPEFQRRGFATEAVAALVEWAFNHREVHRIVAETLPLLKSSIRVLEKNQFHFAGLGSEPGVIRFERPRRLSEP